MTLAILVAIAVMWMPVAFTNLGSGEGKTTGFVCAVVGVCVVLSAILQAAIFKDPFVAGLLFAHGILYCCVGHALLSGAEDLRTVGNVSFTVALISLIYMILWITGGTAADGKVLVAPSKYLAMCAAGYVVLTLEVWGAFHGKFSAAVLAWSLIIWVFVGLWIPAFWLMAKGTLPF